VLQDWVLSRLFAKESYARSLTQVFYIPTVVWTEQGTRAVLEAASPSCSSASVKQWRECCLPGLRNLKKNLEREKKSQYISENVDCTWVTVFIVSSKHLISLVSTSILPFRNGLHPAGSSAVGYISLSLPEHDVVGVGGCRRRQQQRHSRPGPRSPSSWSLGVAVYLQI